MRKTIPSNYNSIDGKLRNFIELIVIDALYIGIMIALKLSFRTCMYVGLGMIPLSAFSIMGIGGQSLTQALYNYIRFLRKRRILDKPTQEYIREKNKAAMLKNQELGKGRKNGKHESQKAQGSKKAAFTEQNENQSTN